MRKNNQYYIRKTHRWLGVILGVQFLMWTISGLYFSWTDIDEIHGDHLVNSIEESTNLGYVGIDSSLDVRALELRILGGAPYLWVNDSLLIDANTGAVKEAISQREAEQIARKYVKDELPLISSELLKEVGPHHEYRGRPLPVWAVKFGGNANPTAYITQRDGSFQRVRHQSWRWFDFLWMFHTMDYQGRDDFNNLLLRVFSLFGLVTVVSGFTLFVVTVRRRR